MKRRSSGFVIDGLLSMFRKSVSVQLSRVKMRSWTFEDGTNMLSQNIDEPSYVVQKPRRAKISTTWWWKRDIAHVCVKFCLSLLCSNLLGQDNSSGGHVSR